jgi:hypothetical protein
MDLFKKAKSSEKRQSQKDCLFCGNLFTPDKRNVNRGWGLYCSKSCAVQKRNELESLSDLDRLREERNIKLRQLLG